MYKDDPVVERVRAARKAIAERHGGDAHGLFEWAKKVEAKCAKRVTGYERKTGHSGNKTST